MELSSGSSFELVCRMDAYVLSASLNVPMYAVHVAVKSDWKLRRMSVHHVLSTLAQYESSTRNEDEQYYITLTN